MLLHFPFLRIHLGATECVALVRHGIPLTGLASLIKIAITSSGDWASRSPSLISGARTIRNSRDSAGKKVRASERGQSRVKTRSTGSLSGLLKSIGGASRVNEATGDEIERSNACGTAMPRPMAVDPSFSRLQMPRRTARSSSPVLRASLTAILDSAECFPLSQGQE